MEIKSINGISLGKFGGGRKIELLADITLEQDVKTILIDKDIEGKTFSANRCLLLLKGRPLENSGFEIIPNSIWLTSTYGICGKSNNFNAGWDMDYIYEIAADEKTFFGYPLTNASACSGYLSYHENASNKNNIYNIKINCNTSLFKAGTRITIYKEE